MLARVRIALARQSPEKATYLRQAQDILAQLLAMAESHGWMYKVVEILGLQALALDLQGKTELALTKLEQAFILAEPGGFVRVFVDEGPPMARLLYEALSQDILPDYVRHLLAAFPDEATKQPDPSKIQSLDEEWIEPLTERELEVLRLVSDGLTNQVIGDKLFLSLNTIKAHTRNIYGKLGVNNRTQAVAKARALGLISID